VKPEIHQNTLKTDVRIQIKAQATANPCKLHTLICKACVEIAKYLCIDSTTTENCHERNRFKRDDCTMRYFGLFKTQVTIPAADVLQRANSWHLTEALGTGRSPKSLDSPLCHIAVDS